MRLSSALLLSSLLAASTAVAEPTTSGLGARGPDQQARPPADASPHRAEVAAADPTATDSTRVTPKAYPSYLNDKASEASCYYVFGELRCDRVPKGPQSSARK